MGYRKDIFRGVSWLGAFRLTTRAISFVRIAIIARLLTPTQFGLFGIVVIVLSITEILTETGINIFLIQKKDEVDDYIDTAWVVSILRGFIIAAVILVLSRFVAEFFNAPDARNLLILASFVPVFRGFINPSVVKFIKDLQFQKEFTYRTSIFFVESVTSLILVFIFHSVYGLVAGLITGAAYEVILSFMLIRPPPKFIFVKDRFREVISKGKWMTASGIFNYLYHNLDTVIVGRLLGISSLGIYDMAYKISSLPISEFSDVITRSTFPVYMKISEDRQRLINAFVKTVGVTTLFVLPVTIIFFYFPKEVILIILGRQWASAAPALKILALYGSLRAISNVANSFFYSVHRQDIVTKITFISLIAMVVSIFPLIGPFGLVCAGISALIGSLAAYPVVGYYFYRMFIRK